MTPIAGSATGFATAPAIVALTLAALLAGPSAAAPPSATPAPPPSAANRPPALVVVIVVDQLPAGKLEEAGGYFTGGFRRLLDAGRRFTRCAHDHACTETGPGHAALLSGLFPRDNGIVLNDWFDRENHRDVYCAGSDRPDAPRNFDLSPAVSAGHLRGENLADLIKRANPASKVYTVSGKDRSAIFTGGHHADGIFWYSLRTGGFTSGPEFIAELPAWGADFWGGAPTAGDLYAKHIPAEWSYVPRPAWGPDDYPYEDPRYSRVTPHPLGENAAAPVKPEERASALARRVFFSPWVDWMTLQLAQRVIEKADLGADGAPDLLVVSLSGIDAVGHAYGPRSQEYLDALVRDDGWLGDLMDAARRRGPVLFALSGDHGVLPLPETLPGGRRVDDDAIRRRLEAGLAARLGREEEGRFIESVHGNDYYLDRRTLGRLNVPLDQAVEAARRELLGSWEVARVYRASDLAAAPGAAGGDPWLDFYRKAYDPARSGDLVIQPCEKCLFTTRAEGTSHGSPYAYDRDVPMIFLGPGVQPGEDAGECRTVDLAPTVAKQLGLAFETPRDGRPLPIAGAVDRADGRK